MRWASRARGVHDARPAGRSRSKEQGGGRDAREEGVKGLSIQKRVCLPGDVTGRQVH